MFTCIHVTEWENCTNLIGQIFYFKKNYKIWFWDFLVACTAGQVYFGFVNLHNMISRKFLRCRLLCFFLSPFHFEVGLLYGGFYFFFSKKSLIEWRCFCALWNCCIFWYTNIYVVRNFRLIRLLPVSVFNIGCSIEMLPYFLQCVWTILSWFWGLNSLLLCVLICAFLPRYHFLVFRTFHLFCFDSFCVSRFWNLLS